MAATDRVTIYAVGDVGVTRADPGSAFTNAAQLLSEPDILFGQLEASLSQEGLPPPTSSGAVKPSPLAASTLRSVGFDVMSFASNHTLDWGAEGLQDTIRLAELNGIALVGVGPNMDKARRPAIVNRNGIKVAFLGYCSVLPPSYWATAEKPGCAPIRIHTFYEPIEPYQPGTPSETFTYAYKEDRHAMEQDIKRAKAQADIVIVSMHWGIHFMPAKIAHYQREVGYAAIDAGADLIVGTHAHILKGIEVYKGKVNFYSLGNFAMDSPVTRLWPNVPARYYERAKLYDYTIDPEWAATYPFPPDSRKTVLVKIAAAGKGITSVSVVPMMINRLNQPTVLHPDEKQFEEVINYVNWCSSDQGLNARLFVKGREVLIQT
ncbi:MAG: CapA family protein [Chloroflexi bacterium]|nr:CapA family protein [Chloroflexota bacterium]